MHSADSTPGPIFIAILFLFIALPLENLAQGTYRIDGYISEMENGYMYLEKRVSSVLEDKFLIADSVVIKDGNFIMRGTVKLPEIFFLRIKGAGTKYRLPVFLENASIKIRGKKSEFPAAMVTGSKIHDRWTAYTGRMNEMLGAIKNFYWPIYEYADSAKNEKLKFILDSLRNKVYQEAEAFSRQNIYSNLDNPLGPCIATAVFFKVSQARELDSLLRQISPGIAASVYVQKLKRDLETWKGTGVGSVIQLPDAELRDTAGKPVTVSMFKGKYLFLDFWASWCLPCRKLNPELLRIYSQFRTSGFEILGIAFDSDRKKWIDAINQDKLVWPHASDLKKWDTEIAKTFSINELPYNILVGPDGKIIAREISLAELRKFLNEKLE